MFSDLDYLKIEVLKEVRMPGHKWIPQDYALVTSLSLKRMARSTKGLLRLTRRMALGSDMHCKK